MSLLEHRARLRMPSATTGTVMAVAAMSTIQLGLALSVSLVDQLGALGTTGLRLAWAGVLLLALVRPRLRDFSGRDLFACALLGTVSAGMMVFFMLAVTRLPLGTASALEFLGPLAVSLCGPGRGRKRWTLLAAIGVVALTEPWHGGIDAVGAGYALTAAACWAAYIVLTQRVGDSVTGLNGLAVSMPVAGCIGLLVAAPSDLGHVTWKLLGATLGLAALSAVLPFVLEFLALRRLTASAFGTLMSLEPAIALLAGLLVLGQIPGFAAAAGVAFVVLAGIGATRTGGRPAPPPPDPRHAVAPDGEHTAAPRPTATGSTW
ncbi:EamA family transporter [Streptomyces luteolus]|uniref:EamA family transporter n=1 Tax=Streptomyces luteolus TaxID=3043615 RepID=A0ABT6SZ90_9ACTN|nr:EamA family transporter [Streptomyces sp. B-S-A12]MDI3420919.1 EamA family transporter [Streptomyces sp. B-S-A12]